jgi:hypothetical protein
MSTGDRDVLSSLPRSRPTRRSAKRDTAAARPPKAPAAEAETATVAQPAPEPVAERPPPAGWAAPEPEGGHRHGRHLVLLTAPARAVGGLTRASVCLGVRTTRGAVAKVVNLRQSGA